MVDAPSASRPAAEISAPSRERDLAAVAAHEHARRTARRRASRARPGASAARRRWPTGRSRSRWTRAPRRAAGCRMNEPNMPKPTSSVARLVISTGGRASSSTSASGCGGALLAARPSRPGSTTPAPIITSVRGLRPAPVVGAGRSPAAGREADGEHDGAADVDAARRADRRLGDEQLREHGGQRGHAARRARRSSGRRRGRRARRRGSGRAPPPMPNVAEIRPMLEDTCSRGNSSRMMREAEREDAAADALQDAAGDEHLERLAQRGDHRAGGEHAQRRSPAAGACRTCRRGGRRSG